MSSGTNDGGTATVKLGAGTSPQDADAIRRAVAGGGPTFFPRHRWFGDKARQITDTSLVAVTFADPQSEPTGPLALTVIEVAFADGGRERYFVPLSVEPGGTPSRQTLAVVTTAAQESYVLNDAIAQPGFHKWLLDPSSTSPDGESGTGEIVWRPGPGYPAARQAFRSADSRVSGAEQSNSAVIFGADLLAKVFRKLRPGLNPDIEISRFLSAQSTFRSFPDLLGDLAFQTPDDLSYSIGMMLPFIPNHGDAWAYTLDLLRDMLLGGTGTDPIAPFRLLGVRTGELHQALATPAEDTAFAAEPISSGDIHGWASGLERSLERTLELIRQRSDQLPAAWQSRLADLSLSTPAIVKRLQGFGHLTGVDKIRVHGDYHLGQVLVTRDHDFVILDFEGEPSRPMEERRAKTSPLKDVAGMLRSLSYARYAALRARPDSVPEDEAATRLMNWEQDARAAFLVGYRSVTADTGATFLPADEGDFTTALSAWTLDKAIYEVNYEINNRPDWLPLPLEALFTAES